MSLNEKDTKILFDLRPILYNNIAKPHVVKNDDETHTLNVLMDLSDICDDIAAYSIPFSIHFGNHNSFCKRKKKTDENDSKSPKRRKATKELRINHDNDDNELIRARSSSASSIDSAIDLTADFTDETPNYSIGFSSSSNSSFCSHLNNDDCIIYSISNISEPVNKGSQYECPMDYETNGTKLIGRGKIDLKKVTQPIIKINSTSHVTHTGITCEDIIKSNVMPIVVEDSSQKKKEYNIPLNLLSNDIGGSHKLTCSDILKGGLAAEIPIILEDSEESQDIIYIPCDIKFKELSKQREFKKSFEMNDFCGNIPVLLISES